MEAYVHNPKEKREEPIIEIKEGAKPSIILTFYMGVPFAIMILALMFDFFRNILFFGTFVWTALHVLVFVGSISDLEKGVKRKRPTPAKKQLPKWFTPAYFLVMITVTAGMELGWYLAPICWIINWALFMMIIGNVRKTFVEEKDVQDKK